MESANLIPMNFVSSNGTLIVNRDGSINQESEFDNESWLSEIAKVDVEELERYYKMQGLEVGLHGDVLDFGYWDNDGNYNEPERSWREDVFHNVDFSKEHVASIIDNSYEWIAENRKV